MTLTGGRPFLHWRPAWRAYCRSTIFVSYMYINLGSVTDYLDIAVLIWLHYVRIGKFVALLSYFILNFCTFFKPPVKLGKLPCSILGSSVENSGILGHCLCKKNMYPGYLYVNSCSLCYHGYYYTILFLYRVFLLTNIILAGVPICQCSSILCFYGKFSSGQCSYLVIIWFS
jgi:hypothetical protein